MGDFKVAICDLKTKRSWRCLRQLVGSHAVLAKQMAELEKRVGSHDKAIKSLFATIHKMMNPVLESKSEIGFKIP